MKEKAGDRYIKWFSELGKEDVNLVGGKSANLGEMTKIGMPVPPGFCITTKGYSHFLEYTELDEKVYSILNSIDLENTQELEEASEKIREMIEKAEMPKDLQEEIFDNYEALSMPEELFSNASSSALSILKKGHELSFVAVRSSATAEDSGKASFAGQQETFVNIKGKFQLIEAVKKCFASLFTARSVYYRIKKGYQHEQVLLSVIVQKMINSEKSGVIFSKNPIDNDRIVVEAVFGLGEGIVSGRINPDHYEVSNNRILGKRIENKKIALTRNSQGDNTIVNLSPEKAKSQVLNESEILKLARYALELEEHYKKPQDIEFAIDREIFIVQTRPITTLHLKKQAEEIQGKEILKGIPASPGIGSGTVKIIRNIQDLSKLKKGNVLVTKMTNPDMVVAMQKSSAIVTDEGGATCIEGDAKILTNRGFIKLREVKNNLEKGEVYTLSIDAKTKKVVWRRVIKAYNRKKPAKKLSLFIHPTGRFEDTISITEDHEVLMLKGADLTKRKLNDVIDFDRKFLTITKLPSLSYSMDLTNFDRNKIMYLTGALLSDGHIAKRESGKPMRILFCQKDVPEKSEFINAVLRYFEDLFSSSLKNYTKPNTIIPHASGYQTIRANNYQCSRAFPAQVINNIKENIVPLSLTLNEECLECFLAGFIDGDGHFSKEKKTIEIYVDKKTESIKEAILISCLRLGISPKIRQKKSMSCIILSDNINQILRLCKRVKGFQEKTEDTKLFSTKQLTLPLKVNDWKGSIWRYQNKDILIGINWLIKYLGKKADNKLAEKLRAIQESDLSTIRMKPLSEEEIDVFNIEVEADSELDHNYVIFSKEDYTPIIVGNCHAAIVSREMGIPAVIGTERATSIFKDGEEITVNGFTGKVYEGMQKKVDAEILPIEKTKTKIKVIVDLPDYAERAAKTGCNSVGLVRIEGIIAESGKHPLFFYKEGKLKEYEEVIYKGVSEISSHFQEIWVRTSDIRSDEYMNLQGAPKEKELNPMLGMHGIRFSLKKPEIFKSELKALKRVQEENSGKNIGIMMPQIISAEEVKETKKILKEIEFEDAFLGVMIETPAAVQIIQEICDEGIKFISFGTNDLTQFTLAIDRGNEQIQYLYDEMHPAILSQIAHVIEICRDNSIETSICGQAASTKPMAEFLVKQGIDSISVNADKAREISELVSELEGKGLKGVEAGKFIMAKKSKSKVENIDDTRQLETELNEKTEQVKEENEKRAEEWKEKESNIKVEEKSREEIKEESKEASEEYPDVDIGIDIFSQQ